MRESVCACARVCACVRVCVCVCVLRVCAMERSTKGREMSGGDEATDLGLIGHELFFDARPELCQRHLR